MKIKAEGISILVAMGTSLLVLSLAFATLASISRSLDQASNLQRSTQLFFASESGAEAAFFHHNARGAGLNFLDSTHASQTLSHPSVQAETNWTIQGRTNTSDSASRTVGNAAFVDILKEGQTLKIPLQWDASDNPTATPPTSSIGTPDYGETDNNNDNLSFTFYRDPANISNSTAKDAFNDRYNFDSGVYPIDNNFDFGENGNNAVLIDWSITRKNSNQGIQTFIPTDNQDCVGFPANPGYICENDFNAMTTSGLQIDTNDTITGKVLPGSIDVDLDEFWDCLGGSGGVNIGDNCSDYQLTIRPLLKYQDTLSGDKIPGLPYELKLTTAGGTVPKTFPQSTYKVVSDVALEDFSQRIEIEVPEKTSIGAFDYVIFD